MTTKNFEYKNEKGLPKEPEAFKPTKPPKPVNFFIPFYPIDVCKIKCCSPLHISNLVGYF